MPGRKKGSKERLKTRSIKDYTTNLQSSSTTRAYIQQLKSSHIPVAVSRNWPFLAINTAE